MLKRLFRDGFRIFFLLAAIWACVSVALWTSWLGGITEAPTLPMAPYLWHAHEMVFGYGAAVVGGFLLTAVLFGRPGFLVVAAGMWLAGRGAMAASATLPIGLVAAVDLAFLPFLASQLLGQVLRRRNPQHLIFLGFVVALATGNGLTHLGFAGVIPANAGPTMGLLALCGLIALLGGRVSPGFIRNAMNLAGRPESAWPSLTPRLDKVIMLLAVLIPWASLWSASLVAAALGGGVLVRLAHWHPFWTRRDALLWSLIAGQGMLGVGLILWALAEWGIGSAMSALHVLGIGAVGGMTLAVMSRAILAHTGRALRAPRLLAVAYGLISVAALLRWIGTDPLILMSGVFWVLAFGLFLMSLGAALLGPRVNRPPVAPPRPHGTAPVTLSGNGGRALGRPE